MPTPATPAPPPPPERQIAAELVAKARSAQREWAAKSFKDRALVMKAVHYRLAERALHIAEAVSEDIRKPTLSALMGDMVPSLDNLGYMLKKGAAALRDEHPGTLLGQFYLGSRKNIIVRQPYGIVAVIGTWNYPVFLNLDPICAALLAGNAVIWKPSEYAPRTVIELMRLFEELPPGVMNLMKGEVDAGRELSMANVDRVVFTGSTMTGRKVMAQAANRATPVGSEMSGKDAAIVTATADLELAAKTLTWAAIQNAGQSAIRPQRLLVHASVYNEFKEKFLAHMGKVVMGPIDRGTTQLGPLLNDALVQYAEAVVDEAVQGGARLLLGGKRATNLHGHFFPPTVLEGVSDKMKAESTDLWAPVVSLRKYETDGQAVRWVNAHNLGITACVWNKDVKAAEAFARQLDVGTVMVNGAVMAAADVMLPFGGRRLSGNMERHGLWSLRSMTRPQGISVARKGLFKPAYQTKWLRVKWALALVAFKSGQYKKLLGLLKKR
jgi:acyl-CoA reductase-like NAD-dependent aldehyde dehydrogenase